MTKLKTLTACILVLVLCAPLAAHAAEADAAFKSLADGIELGIKKIAQEGKLDALGWKILSFLAVANVVWLLIKGHFSGSGLNGVLADLAPFGVSFAIAAAFMGGGGSGSISLVTALDESINVIGTTLTGAPMGSVGELLMSSAVKALDTIRNLLFMPASTTPVDGFLQGIFQVVSAIPAIFMSLIAAIVSTFLILVALCVYMANLVISQVTLEIAKMFAPVFIPFLIWRPTAWLFDGWLRFFLGAALLKIVGLLLLQVTSVMMQSVLDLSTQIAANAPSDSVLDPMVFDITRYAVIILMSGIGALLMSKAPSIASGILSGSGGVGFSGWGDITSKSPATKMIMGGMGEKGGGGPVGGAMKGATGANALSGVTNMMPNFMKPATNALGAIASKYNGVQAAKEDSKSAKNMGDGTKNISRDMSKMSAATQRSYMAHLEAKNARSAAQASSPGFYGPPSPRITVSRPVSSTSRQEK
jgi:type IV secretory pathway VirB6-like protein